MRYFTLNKQQDIKVSNGNSKIGNNTIIFNMSSAKNCPSRKLGFCKVPDSCYADKSEFMYPNVLPARDRQEHYWLETSVQRIALDFKFMISKHRKAFKRIKSLRFNEAGDFHSQDCVNKLDVLSRYLKKHYGITTYGYTARKDLDFSDVSFLVKSSGYNNGNNGRCIVTDKHKGRAPKGFVTCPGSCRSCDICKSDKGINVVFVKH